MSHNTRTVAALLLACSLPAFGQTEPILMIPNASDDTVALYDAFDGSLIDPDFIDGPGLGLITSVFVEARQIGDEIWVTDQLEDVVFRFSLDGRTSLGVISDLLLNAPEGFEVVGDTMLVASRDGVISIDIPSATYLGMLEYRGTDSSINDITRVGDVLLASNSDTDDIDVIAMDGAYITTLIDSDGVDGLNFPAQINTDSASGLLIGGFGSPQGIYRFDIAGASTGPALPTNRAVRGVHELGNGNFIFSNNDGVFIYHTGSGAIEMVRDGRSSYITVLDTPPCLADLNGDGRLNFFDIAAYVTMFASGDSEADINFDGILNFFDLSAYITRFNASCTLGE